MRVLHVLAEKGYSGGELQLEHVVRHLKDQEHDQAFVLAPGAKFAEVLRDRIGIPDGRVHVADLRRPLRPFVARSFRRALRAESPDVLHFGCGRSLLWGGLFALGVRRKDGTRALRVTTRRIDYPIAKSFWKAGRYKHLVDHTVANCLSVQRRVLDAGVPPQRVTVVHEGIDVEPWRNVTDDRAAARARLGFADDAQVVVCPATLRPRKGQRDLIDAFGLVAVDRPRAVLLLAGDGPDRAELRAHADRLGLGDRVRVPGSIRPPEPVFAAADLLVMPSYHEGLSNACLEGSAAGLALIVSDVGGLPEIVEHDVTGLVIQPGNVDELADGLARLLDSDELRLRFGASGAERTRSMFTAERSVRGIESLWLRLLDERRTVAG